MENINSKHIQEDVKLTVDLDFNEIGALYPKIHESTIPLSNAKIGARIFFKWKQEKLIDLPEFSKNDWVRLNIFQYVWVKIIKQLRLYGYTFESIKKIKEHAFSNIFDLEIGKTDEIISLLQNSSKLNKVQIEATKRLIIELKERNGIPDKYKIINTKIGTEIISILLRGTISSLVVVEKDGMTEVDFTSFNSKKDIDSLVTIYPNIQIPIKRIVEEFFENPENLEKIETLGLFSVQEKEVIDAVRDKNFKEIIIKRKNGKNEVSIEVVKEADIVDEQKIKEIKRIFGLNEYSEITLSFRNEKHLYFKNTRRL